MNAKPAESHSAFHERPTRPKGGGSFEGYPAGGFKMQGRIL